MPLIDDLLILEAQPVTRDGVPSSRAAGICSIRILHRAVVLRVRGRFAGSEFARIGHAPQVLSKCRKMCNLYAQVRRGPRKPRHGTRLVPVASAASIGWTPSARSQTYLLARSGFLRRASPAARERSTSLDRLHCMCTDARLHLLPVYSSRRNSWRAGSSSSLPGGGSFRSDVGRAPSTATPRHSRTQSAPFLDAAADAAADGAGAHHFV